MSSPLLLQLLAAAEGEGGLDEEIGVAVEFEDEEEEDEEDEMQEVVVSALRAALRFCQPFRGRQGETFAVRPARVLRSRLCWQEWILESFFPALSGLPVHAFLTVPPLCPLI